MTTWRSQNRHYRWAGLLLTVATAVAFAVLVPAGSAGAALDPVAQDQQEMLAQLNRARWNPAEFGDASGIDLGTVLPRPPAAVEPRLTGSAAFKANEIADYGYFAHQSAVTGMWPNQLARQHGYDLPPGFADDTNNIESLHWGSPDPFSVVASFAGSPSHRDHVFGQGWFGWHTEIGIGRSSTDNVWAVHTGYRDGAGVFLTGTVFDDLDGDGIMDSGEGVPGITISIEGIGSGYSGSAETNGGGGYSVEIPSGTHRITVSGPGFEGIATGVVEITDYNVGADFLSGLEYPVVRGYQLCAGREPTILGTSGNDVINGTPGDDVIHGLGGNDKIYGRGGDDIICGGWGRDRIKGGTGRDTILGGGRRDVIRGNGHRDRIRAGGGNDYVAGGGGNDTVLGQAGNDVIEGERGRDRIDGGPESDFLDGGPRSDACEAGEILIDCP